MSTLRPGTSLFHYFYCSEPVLSRCCAYLQNSGFGATFELNANVAAVEDCEVNHHYYLFIFLRKAKTNSAVLAPWSPRA